MSTKISCYKYQQHQDDTIKKVLYDVSSYKPFVSENKEYNLCKISLYNDLFQIPLPKGKKNKYGNHVFIGTCLMKTIFNVNPYKQEPYAKKMTVGLLGNVNDNVWTPPEDDKLNKQTMYMKELLDEWQNNIAPGIIMNLPDESKKIIFKALKLKGKDITIDDIRGKMEPSLKFGEHDDKLYGPQIALKLLQDWDKKDEGFKYDLELYSDKGKIINSIHDDVLNIANEMPQDTEFMAGISPSMLIRDSKLYLQWSASQISIVNRPEEISEIRQSAFGDELYAEMEDDVPSNIEVPNETPKNDTEVPSNTIESSSEDESEDDE